LLAETIVLAADQSSRQGYNSSGTATLQRRQNRNGVSERETGRERKTKSRQAAETCRVAACAPQQEIRVIRVIRG